MKRARAPGLLWISALLAGCGGASPLRPTAGVHLVPAHVPTGYRPCGAFDLADSGVNWKAVRQRSEASGWQSVWADTSRSEPWSGPIAVVYERPADRDWGHYGAEAVTVRGKPAEVAPMPLVQGVSASAWGHIVTWRPTPKRILELALRGGTRAETIRMAQLVTMGPGGARLPGSALGPKTAPVDRRLIESFQQSGWLLDFRFGRIDDARARVLTIVGGPSSPNKIKLAALFSLSSHATTIHGAQGISYTAWDPKTGPFGVTWESGDHQVITVLALGGSADDARSVAESLQSVGDSEWVALVKQGNACVAQERPSPTVRPDRAVP